MKLKTAEKSHEKFQNLELKFLFEKLFVHTRSQNFKVWSWSTYKGGRNLLFVVCKWNQRKLSWHGRWGNVQCTCVGWILQEAETKEICGFDNSVIYPPFLLSLQVNLTVWKMVEFFNFECSINVFHRFLWVKEHDTYH